MISFNHMQDLPLSYFDTRTHGDIMSVYTNDVDTLREAMSRSWPMIVSGSVTVFAVTVAMFIYNWVMALSSSLSPFRRLCILLGSPRRAANISFLNRLPWLKPMVTSKK
jgi:ABC-type multidrug transport system fused ATPase/permease subunit